MDLGESMTRAVVSVATTAYYQRGQARLMRCLRERNEQFTLWGDAAPSWPTHQDKPYAFKAFALKHAADAGVDLLLWTDASILPVRSLEPLWERIERDGYWFSRSGWSNYEWTADSAYPDLFPDAKLWGFEAKAFSVAREINRKIEHVVATTFGLNLKHPKGKAFLDEYYRLASETRAFCGPWINSNYYREGLRYIPTIYDARCAPCGPPDVRGHRHDQTAASVIAWRLGFELTSSPEIFAYGRADEAHDERTILLADGSYS